MEVSALLWAWEDMLALEVSNRNAVGFHLILILCGKGTTFRAVNLGWRLMM